MLQSYRLRGKRNAKTDIFSLGMTFWEMVACEIPYAEIDDHTIREEVKSGRRAPIPEATPKRFAKLIALCWSQHAEDRPTASACVERLEKDARSYGPPEPTELSQLRNLMLKLHRENQEVQGALLDRQQETVETTRGLRQDFIAFQ